MAKTVKGLCFEDGKCFAKPNFIIPGLIPGEEALVDIVKKGDKRLICKIKTINTASPKRANLCSYSNCGGCDFKHINYQEQLNYKTDYIRSLFKDFKVKVNETIGMDSYVGSRHKIIQTFGYNKGKLTAGIYEEGTHNIVNIENCPIQNKEANEIVKDIKNIMSELKLMPYNEDSKTGLIRHVYIRCGYYTKEIMVVIVTAMDAFPARSQFIKKLLESNPNIKTIIQNINSRGTSVVLGDKTRVLYGPGYISDMLLGLKFNISSQSFYQVNPKQTEVLYNLAIKMAELKETDIVFDAYSGIGTISLIASKYCKTVIGVEIVNSAVKDAINNAKINNIKNCYFACDDATKYIVKMAEEKAHIDCLFMDPPRKGSDIYFLEAVLALKPKRIVYISCGPDTQVRDIKFLLGKYELTKIQPVDMFCLTHHVECVAHLILKNSK